LSRIGKNPIAIPSGVKVKVDGRKIVVEGPKGSLEREIPGPVEVAVDEARKAIVVTRGAEDRETRAIHGLIRSLIANMVTGVTDGFEKRLEIRGVGYRAEQQGANVLFRLGFSHDTTYEPPEGVTLSVENNLIIVVRGADKRAVGHVAAEIRSLRPVEAYKGKGIRYVGERIRLKPGKAAKVGADLGG